MRLARLAALATLALALLAAPTVGEAQQGAGGHRIGYLSPGFRATGIEPTPVLAQFRARLTELGYVEGQTFTMELRFAEGNTERLPVLAADLAQLRPSVIVTSGSSATAAVKRATATIPIVMAASLDPVRDGLVQSLARPGGNVTGLTVASDAALIGKRLQLARDVLPGATRLALVPAPRPRSQGGENWLRDAEAAARAVGFTTQVLEVHGQPRWDQIFAEAVRGHADIVCFVEWSPYIGLAKQIADQALRFRLPTVFSGRRHVESGGLLSYGTNAPELARRAADYVDKILKGAKPADLPVEQATKFDLVINLKTAKALGLTIPPAVLARADEVIQ